MNLEEWLQLTLDAVHHAGGEGEVERFARDGRQLVGYRVDIVVDEDGCLVDGQFLATGILSEAAVVGDEVCQVLGARLHAQHDGSVHQGDVLRYVGQVFDAVVHGEPHLHHVALLPFAVDGDIAARSGVDVDGAAVYRHGEVARLHPSGIAHQQGEVALPLGDGDFAGLGVGELGLLPELHAPLAPVELGGDEEVHIQRVALMGVDKLAVLAVVLHSRAHAAPHGLVGGGVVAVVARTGGCEVDVSAMFGML